MWSMVAARAAGKSVGGWSSGFRAWAAALLGLLASLVPLAPVRADQAAARYMDQVARELVAAMKTRSGDVIGGVIKRHGDVGWIGSSALGSYGATIAPADKAAYLDGMTRFIARYCASKAADYIVANYQILGAKAEGPSVVHVDTRVIMTSGTSYDVRWLLYKRANGYKVRDAQVLSFWMTPLLRKIFEDYIGENGGRVKALVLALNK